MRNKCSPSILLLVTLILGVAHAEQEPKRDLDLPLAGVNLYEPTYWDSAFLFNDLMRQGSSWISHKPNQPGTWDDKQPIQLNDNGYPVRLLTNQAVRMILVMTDRPIPTGDYTLTWEGTGELLVEVAGQASRRFGPADENKQLVRISSEAAKEPHIFLSIQETDQEDPIRDIHFWMPGTAENKTLFSQHLKDLLKSFSVIRPMHWTKGNEPAGQEFRRHWKDRSRTSWCTWGATNEEDQQRFFVGVPYEIMIALANKTDKDIWITVPHLATEDYMRQLATLVRDTLEPGRRVWIEYSNEHWNWDYPVATWLNKRAEKVRKAQNLEDYWQGHAYGRKSSELFEIFHEVFNDNSRIVTVLAGQAGWGDPLINAFNELEQLGKAHLVDVLAVAPYFPDFESGATVPMLKKALRGGIKDTEWAMIFKALNGEVDDLFNARSEVGRELARNKALAARLGLPLVAYEGGQHFTAWHTPQLAPIIEQVNRRPEMYDTYRKYLSGWRRFGGQTFVHFHLVGGWNKNEAFGLLESGIQAPGDSPKYRAMATWIADTSKPGRQEMNDVEQDKSSVRGKPRR